MTGHSPSATRNTSAPDGKNYEGVGIPPTVEVPVFTAAELAQHQDSALGVPW